MGMSALFAEARISDAGCCPGFFDPAFVSPAVTEGDPAERGGPQAVPEEACPGERAETRGATGGPEEFAEEQVRFSAAQTGARCV